jgi:hypothetical protein
LRPHEIAVARIDRHRVGVDAVGFEQGPHQRRFVLAVAVVPFEYLGRRMRRDAAAARKIGRHRDVIRLLHERADRPDLVERRRAGTRQRRGLRLNLRRDLRRRIFECGLQRRFRGPVRRRAQRRVGLGLRKIGDPQPRLDRVVARAVGFFLDPGEIAQFPGVGVAGDLRRYRGVIEHHAARFPAGRKREDEARDQHRILVLERVRKGGEDRIVVFFDLVGEHRPRRRPGIGRQHLRARLVIDLARVGERHIHDARLPQFHVFAGGQQHPSAKFPDVAALYVVRLKRRRRRGVRLENPDGAALVDSPPAVGRHGQLHFAQQREGCDLRRVVGLGLLAGRCNGPGRRPVPGQQRRAGKNNVHQQSHSVGASISESVWSSRR